MPSSEPLIRCAGLVRRFGERRALAGVDLEVAARRDGGRHRRQRRGQDHASASSGDGAAPVRGRGVGSRPPASLQGDAGPPGIGYIAHDPLVYPGLSARENLELYAALYNVGTDGITDALELVGLGERGDDQAAEFSRGMLARLAIARATLHDPELLLLDEPTAGLDADGHAVLLASCWSVTAARTR